MLTAPNVPDLVICSAATRGVFLSEASELASLPRRGNPTGGGSEACPTS